MKFKKRIFIRPAFDKRDTDPSKNYGIHGADMIFTLIGEKGAVSFVLYTNWHLPHVVEEFHRKPDHIICKPLPADIGYHSPYPMYEGQKSRNGCCEYIGVPCYSDGSASNSDAYYEALISRGSKGLWKKMKLYYKIKFEELSNDDK